MLLLYIFNMFTYVIHTCKQKGIQLSMMDSPGNFGLRACTHPCCKGDPSSYNTGQLVEFIQDDFTWIEAVYLIYFYRAHIRNTFFILLF